MFTIPNILVPIAFTDGCRAAIRYAHGLAERWKSELHVLHVIEPPKGMFAIESEAALADLCRHLKNDARLRLQQFVADCVFDSRVQKHVISGSESAAQIVAFAHSQDLQLILMPTHGYGPVRRFLTGSVTAKVLHDAKVPVWTGTHLGDGTVHDPEQIRTVLAAVDLGPQSRAVIAYASGLATLFGATLHLLHVLPALPDVDWQVKAIAVANRQLNELMTITGTTAKLDVRFGSVSTNVVRTACSTQSDLLVIGRGGLHGDGRLPSEVYAIIRAASCPVLSV